MFLIDALSRLSYDDKNFKVNEDLEAQVGIIMYHNISQNKFEKVQ